MYNLDAINFEQLATRTDRLLVLGQPQRFPRGSAPVIVVDEPTVFVRAPRRTHSGLAVAAIAIYASIAITVVRLLV